jgi:hypothetical protein
MRAVCGLLVVNDNAEVQSRPRSWSSRNRKRWGVCCGGVAAAERGRAGRGWSRRAHLQRESGASERASEDARERGSPTVVARAEHTNAICGAEAQKRTRQLVRKSSALTNEQQGKAQALMRAEGRGARARRERRCGSRAAIICVVVTDATGAALFALFAAQSARTGGSGGSGAEGGAKAKGSSAPPRSRERQAF